MVSYTITPSALGRLLVAATERGVCAVALGDEDEELAAALQGQFGQATLTRDDVVLQSWVAPIVAYLDGAHAHPAVPVALAGTAFQRQVWAALQQIPYGETRTYAEVAALIGRPDAVRAVAGACAANKVALVVPCHRVVRSDGGLGGYRWGLARKERLLAQEAGR